MDWKKAVSLAFWTVDYVLVAWFFIRVVPAVGDCYDGRRWAACWAAKARAPVELGAMAFVIYLVLTWLLFFRRWR